MGKTFALFVSLLASMTVQNNDVYQLASDLEGTGVQVAAVKQESEEQELFVKDHSDVSNARKDWYFKRNKTHVPPEAQKEIDLTLYNSYYLGDTGQKEIYLTFDSGYDNGLTSEILDILKEKEVPAAFFVLKGYITKNPDLIKRMADEGHIVGNHSSSHKNFPELTGKQVEQELKDTAAAYKEVTGKQMPGFFRPPSGVYSERVLAYAKDLGYKTVFWSFAYKDWEEENQPGKTTAYNMMVDNTHNGSIMMLHSVSQSNKEALAEAIDAIRAQGYVFKSLNELPKN